jgi:hypothetical protein
MKPEEIAARLAPEEKDALAVLLAGGFEIFTECKIEDLREVATGRRRPTFRHSGRWDLMIGFKKLAEREVPVIDEVPVPDVALTPVVTPVDNMGREELLQEAKNYPALTGEYKMKVGELRQAIVEQRELRREIVNRKFTFEG